MIPIERLLYKLDLRLNKKSSTEHQSIPIEDKILALNEAQIILVKSKLNANNLYNAGLDAFKKRYEDLQALVVPFEELAVTKTTEIYPSYKANLNSLSKPYFLPLETIASCTKGSCTERPLYIFDILKHGDLQIMMNNNNYKPSFEYQETFAIISSEEMYIYTDGTFTVDNIKITYLRYPINVDIAGYINFDGSASTTIDCELAEQLENELLDIAALGLAIDTENTPQVQMSELRNKIHE